MKFDIAIIGAGVIGLAIAEALAGKNRHIVILERNPSFGQETSSRNSEVIHAGIYFPRDLLKSRLCVAGNRLLYEWCRQKSVPHRAIGKLIVATTDEECADLEKIKITAEGNGVEGLTILTAAEVRRKEPNIRTKGALFSPVTGIIDSHSFMRSLLHAAESRGAILTCKANVTAIQHTGSSYELTINSGEYSLQTPVLINSAGLGADHIASLVGIDIDERGYRLYPCKGNYFTASPVPRLNHLVYPVPLKDHVGLGIHATLDLTGRIRFGPDSRYLEQSPKESLRGDSRGPRQSQTFDYSVDECRQEAFFEAITRYLPGLSLDALHPDMSGIRPKLQGPGDPVRDFVICEESAAGFPGLINLIGMESPGLTSSLAIGDYIKQIGYF